MLYPIHVCSAAQAAQRDAEERLAADLLADALKADAAELEHQQRQVIWTWP